jgi:oligoendopeptidase F
MKQKLIWNLSDLFKSNKAFYNEIANINNDLKDIYKYKDSFFNCEILLIVLNFKWAIKKRTNNILIYGSLKYYKDIKNKNTIKMKEAAEQLVTRVDADVSFIDEKIIHLGESTINEYLLLDSRLEIYRLYLDNIFRLRSHIQDNKTNLEIEKLKNNINIILTNYNSANQSIDLGEIVVDGEYIKLTPSNIVKYLSSRDRETRMQAYLLVNGAYKEKSEEFATILNVIYSNRVNISKLEHYNSVTEEVLFDENINPIILEKLINSVQSNLNLMKRYLRLKSGALLISDPHLYDYSVPFDNGNKKKYSLEEAIYIIKGALEPLGEEYLKVIDLLLSSGHIDAMLDDKKHQSITFSWGTYSFMNYREAYIDLKNLIHELGHLVNAYLSKERQPYIYADSTVFVGETASLVNEILLNRYLYQNAKDEDEKLFYLSTSIENYITQVFRQTMYTEFENMMYQYATNGVELSSDLLATEYISILKKYYGETTIYDDYTNFEWARFGHLYRHSYYVYKYATGLMIASAVVDSLIDKETLSNQNYLEFLSSGSNDYPTNLLLKLGINLTDETILNKGYDILKNEINEFDKITNQKS